MKPRKYETNILLKQLLTTIDDVPTFIKRLTWKPGTYIYPSIYHYIIIIGTYDNNTNKRKHKKSDLSFK